MSTVTNILTAKIQINKIKLREDSQEMSPKSQDEIGHEITYYWTPNCE